MTRIEKTIEMRVPIEKVFEFISDPENIIQHKLGPDDLIKEAKIERLTKGSIGKGSIWHWRAKLGGRILGWDDEYIEWEPPRRWATEQKGGVFKKWGTMYKFDSTASEVKYTIIVEYDQPYSALGKMIDKVKEFLEGRG
jgi:uncharacterized protein YndB with AHSA1/START domain